VRMCECFFVCWCRLVNGHPVILWYSRCRGEDSSAVKHQSTLRCLFPATDMIHTIGKMFSSPPQMWLASACRPVGGPRRFIQVATSLDLDLAFGAVDVNDDLACTSLLSPLSLDSLRMWKGGGRSGECNSDSPRRTCCPQSAARTHARPGSTAQRKQRKQAGMHT